MIVASLQSIEIPVHIPRLRIREEKVGGQAFDPLSGRITYLTEAELADWKVKAEHDPGLVYYAARSWDSEPLTDGCRSSPVRIYMEVTQACNLSCLMCYRSAGKVESDEMEKLEILRLVRDLAGMGVHEVRITGGEPTLRADLLDIIDTAVRAGMYVSIGTNGLWPAGMAEALLARQIGRYIVSVEGVGEVNDVLRGPGAFEQAQVTIDRLVRAGKMVRINTMLSRTTLAHLPELVAWCAMHQVKHMSLIPPRPVGRASAGLFAAEMPGHAEMEAAARLITRLGQDFPVNIEFQYNLYRPRDSGQSSDPVLRKTISCPAGSEAAFISPAGWLYACGCSPGGSAEAALREPFAAANVRYLDASGIWQAWQRSAVWQPFRNLCLSKDPACFRCAYYGQGCFGSCPVHAFLSGGAFNGHDPLCWVRDSAEKN